MEIKATLNKPCTDKQRLDFIVEQNHKLGYTIKETNYVIEAWGLTEEEIAENAKEVRRKELIAQLAALDLNAIRPLRAKVAGVATEEDEEYLANNEAQVEQLRAELQELNED